MNVIIEEYCDGFSIRIINEDNEEVLMKHFDQEESLEGIVEVFECLGHDSHHEEVY